MRPGGEHDALREAATVERVARALHDQHEGEPRTREVPGELAEAGEGEERGAVAHDDDVPWLRVLGRARPAGDLEDVREHIVVDRSLGEAPHDAERTKEPCLRRWHTTIVRRPRRTGGTRIARVGTWAVVLSDASG